ncbi:hypothetical protein LTR66_014563 [Elasticomyces elasticus]|nr:hypothetical protein LTR66_014563 [Elasticomyces elasticus]
MLVRRQASDASSSTSLSSSAPSQTGGQESTTTSTTASASTQTAGGSASSPLPSAFDTSLGSNFTSSTCPTFFNRFLSNGSFIDCHPFSLLLQVSAQFIYISARQQLTSDLRAQTSNSFFAAERSLVRLTQTLDATCNTDVRRCGAIMASLAQEIRSNGNCGADYANQNPMVMQAYNGFVAYQPLYHAGCLKDAGGNYCFANAITNTSSPSSAYIYYLPLGLALPAGSMPACNACLQATMDLFRTAAANASQPLSQNYAGAARQVDGACGVAFAGGKVGGSGTVTVAAGYRVLVGLAAAAGLVGVLW